MKPLMNAGRTLALLGALSLVGTGAHAGLFDNEPVGTSADCMKENSKAFCALDAAGISKGIKDLNRQQVVSRLANGESSGNALAIVNALGAVGALTKVWENTSPAVPNGAEAALFVLDIFLAVPGITQGNNLIFGWMPYELADSPEKARAVFQQMVLDATDAVFAEQQVMDATTSIPPQSTKSEPYSLTALEFTGKIVKGPNCGDSGCMLINRRKPVMNQMRQFAHGGLPQAGTAPAWAGGYKAWTFTRAGVVWPMELWTDGGYRSNRYLPHVSAKLPKWAYVSTTPQFVNADIGLVNKGQMIPLVYNEGKPMAPIFPEFDFEKEAAQKVAEVK